MAASQKNKKNQESELNEKLSKNDKKYTLSNLRKQLEIEAKKCLKIQFENAIGKKKSNKFTMQESWIKEKKTNKHEILRKNDSLVFMT